MELVTESLLFKEGGLISCPAGGVPMWHAIGAKVKGTQGAWGSLLTAFVWRDREHFLLSLTAVYS